MMGLGIAIDVAVATLAMVRRLDTPMKKFGWVAGVSGSHILFPIVGGALSAGGGLGSDKFGINSLLKTATGIDQGGQRLVSYAGFRLLANFLDGEINEEDNQSKGEGEEAIEEEEEDDAEAIVDAMENREFGKFFQAIVGVSVDALVSGPAKWEQCRVNGWSPRMIGESIGIAGLTVGLVAAAAIFGAEKLHKKWIETGDSEAEIKEKIENSKDPLLFVETLALNFFGMQALLNGTFGLGANTLALLLGDTILTTKMFSPKGKDGHDFSRLKTIGAWYRDKVTK